MKRWLAVAVAVVLVLAFVSVPPALADQVATSVPSDEVDSLPIGYGSWVRLNGDWAGGWAVLMTADDTFYSAAMDVKLYPTESPDWGELSANLWDLNDADHDGVVDGTESWSKVAGTDVVGDVRIPADSVFHTVTFTFNCPVYAGHVYCMRVWRSAYYGYVPSVTSNWCLRGSGCVYPTTGSWRQATGVVSGTVGPIGFVGVDSGGLSTLNAAVCGGPVLLTFGAVTVPLPTNYSIRVNYNSKRTLWDVLFHSGQYQHSFNLFAYDTATLAAVPGRYVVVYGGVTVDGHAEKTLLGNYAGVSLNIWCDEPQSNTVAGISFIPDDATLGSVTIPYDTSTALADGFTMYGDTVDCSTAVDEVTPTVLPTDAADGVISDNTWLGRIANSLLDLADLAVQAVNFAVTGFIGGLAALIAFLEKFVVFVGGLGAIPADSSLMPSSTVTAALDYFKGFKLVADGSVTLWTVVQLMTVSVAGLAVIGYFRGRRH